MSADCYNLWGFFFNPNQTSKVIYIVNSIINVHYTVINGV